MIETVTAFKTQDGRLFEIEKEAIQHDLVQEFYTNYYDNRLLGNYAGSYVEPDSLIDWIKANKDFILALLGVSKQIQRQINPTRVSNEL